MIEIDFNEQTFTCPYCGRQQAFSYGNMVYSDNSFSVGLCGKTKQSDLEHIRVYHICCANDACKKIIITGLFTANNKQFDILPQQVHKSYPSYIPQQIRDDYTEAADIIELSPKAAATLFRRCLQGMIRDFWNIKDKNLSAEISQLKNKVLPSMWSALEGVRKIGNIGAHMETDVNLIVDIDVSEAKMLQKLIELLFDKWYIARHDEEELFNDVSDISDGKQAERKTNKNARDER